MCHTSIRCDIPDSTSNPTSSSAQLNNFTIISKAKPPVNQPQLFLSFRISRYPSPVLVFPRSEFDTCTYFELLLSWQHVTNTDLGNTGTSTHTALMNHANCSNRSRLSSRNGISIQANAEAIRSVSPVFYLILEICKPQICSTLFGTGNTNTSGIRVCHYSS